MALITPETVLKRRSQILFHVVGEEMVLFPPANQPVLHLLKSPAAQRIWTLLDGARSVSDIASVIAQEFDVDPGRAQEDTLRLLSELHEKTLVEEA